MNYTDKQLKQSLADMLPQSIYNCGELYIYDADFAGLDGYRHVLDTELLHLCWLVEENLENKLNLNYYNLIVLDPHATWQRRVVALAEVKGIEI
jgi:hypothetical protein